MFFDFFGPPYSSGKIRSKINKGEPLQEAWFEGWTPVAKLSPDSAPTSFYKSQQAFSALVERGDTEGLKLFHKYIPQNCWDLVHGLRNAPNSNTWETISSFLPTNPNVWKQTLSLLIMHTYENLNLPQHTPAGLINLIKPETAPVIFQRLTPTQCQRFLDHALQEEISPNTSSSRRSQIQQATALARPIIAGLSPSPAAETVTSMPLTPAMGEEILCMPDLSLPLTPQGSLVPPSHFTAGERS